MAAFDRNRDGRQTTYGLLCDRAGCPVAIEVFEGNADEPTTVGRKVDKIRRRFGIGRVALAGGRDMITSARVREELNPADLDWISALKSTDIRKVTEGPLTPEVPVPAEVAETASPDFPGERLMVCFNPRLQDERRRKRDELLQAMEERLEKIARIIHGRGSNLRSKEAITRRIDKDTGHLKVAKHFEIRCENDGLSWRRRQEQIDREEALDGIWVVRTSLGVGSIGPAEAVEACDSLARVELAFRQIKASRLKEEPIFVYSEARVHAHVFLCMLAYHVEWHMRRRMAPILSDEDNPKTARAPSGETVHGFHTLLADLSTVALNDVSLGSSRSFATVTAPTPRQKKAFELLGVDLAKMFPKSCK